MSMHKQRVLMIGALLIGSALAATAYWCEFVRLPPAPVQQDQRNILAMLLWTQQFGELDRTLDDGAYRYWHDGGMSGNQWASWFSYLENLDPAFAQRYDEWVERAPKSGWARMTRGLFLVNRGASERGSDYIGETSPGQLQRMHEYFVRARADLEFADQHVERCALCMGGLIRIKMFEGEGGIRELFDRSIGYDINLWEPTWSYYTTLYPQWGGSEAAMQAFIEETRNRVPELGTRLESTFHFRRGLAAANEGDETTEAVEYQEAIRIWPIMFALENLADLYIKQHNYVAAIPLLEKNLSVNDKNDLYTLELLAQAYDGAGRPDDARQITARRQDVIDRYKGRK